MRFHVPAAVAALALGAASVSTFTPAPASAAEYTLKWAVVTRGDMQDMLRDLLAGLKKTVMLVTHDLDEALYLADRIVLLGEGKVICNLEPEEFLRSHQPEIGAYMQAFHRGQRTAVEGRP